MNLTQSRQNQTSDWTGFGENLTLAPSSSASTPLALWALAGILELFWPQPPWPRISNPLFTPAMLLWQWFWVALAAGVFWVGALRRDARLPKAMAWIYGAMALTCAWQTFFVLQHPERFRQMGLEFAEYAVILWFLFRSKWVQAHLRRQDRVLEA